MKQIKKKLRTQLTDVHLEDQLRLRTTMVESNIELLIKDKQYQKKPLKIRLVVNLVFFNK